MPFQANPNEIVHLGDGPKGAGKLLYVNLWAGVNDDELQRQLESRFFHSNFNGDLCVTFEARDHGSFQQLLELVFDSVNIGEFTHVTYRADNETVNIPLHLITNMVNKFKPIRQLCLADNINVVADGDSDSQRAFLDHCRDQNIETIRLSSLLGPSPKWLLDGLPMVHGLIIENYTEVIAELPGLAGPTNNNRVLIAAHRSSSEAAYRAHLNHISAFREAMEHIHNFLFVEYSDQLATEETYSTTTILSREDISSGIPSGGGNPDSNKRSRTAAGK
jgi:hypothetical protein